MHTSSSSPLEFIVEIGPDQGQGYPLKIESPAGEAEKTMHFPFDEAALEIRLLKLKEALRSTGGKYRLALSDQEKIVQQFGRELFEAILPGETRSFYDVSLEKARTQSTSLQLQLRIQPPELAALPWEFLFDSHSADYICLYRETPIIRYLALPQPIDALEVEPPLRVLGMVASPSDQDPLDIESEKYQIQKALERLPNKALVKLDWVEGQNWRDLQRAMRGGPWHVFHFIGHGRFNRSSDEGEIALVREDDGQADFLGARELARLLVNHRTLRLVVLNACEGGRGGQIDIFSSTASILVQRGIPSVLAMQYAITDQAAIVLASAFYEALAEGLPVDAAVSEARLAVSLAVKKTLEWGIPVLYMRSPDGVLFKLTKKPAVAHVKPEEKAPPDNVEAAMAKTITPAPPQQIERQTPTKTARKKRREEEELKQQELLLEVIPDVKLRLMRVPVGEFLMGSDRNKDTMAVDNETPQHKVYLEEYLIGKYPLTVAQFAAFAKASSYKTTAEKEGSGWTYTGSKWKDVKGANWQHPREPGSNVSQKADHPVTLVSWDDAVAFCEWASQVTGRKVRLPSEAEWEKAARGTDGRIWPWSNKKLDNTYCNFGMNEKDTTPVGKYSPKGDSPYGCADMAGNVWEWTGSLMKGYPYNPGDGREDLKDRGRRVLRGGAFYFNRGMARCACRLRLSPVSGGGYDGFRVVVSPF